MTFNGIYSDKRVLVTGHTGFKGSWLCFWLLKLGAKVYGLANEIPTDPSHFEAAGLQKKITHYEQDIRDSNGLQDIINSVKPDFIFHLAAQSLVRKSFDDPALTIQTNVLGTMNVLEALRMANHPCNAVIVTSDKCYDNNEWYWGYRETDALGGDDPYSASKGAAELLIKTYAKSFFNNANSNVKVASTRAGNVIGGGDWALDRIVPDCMKAWSQDNPVNIRNPQATRPWQHVLEPLSGYLLLGQKLDQEPQLNGEPFNFGPEAEQNHTVEQLIANMKKGWPEGKVNIIKNNNDSFEKESTYLKLCCDKALHLLGWQANLSFMQTVDFTVRWYQQFYQDKNNTFSLSSDQIDEYVNIASEQNRVWVSHAD